MMVFVSLWMGWSCLAENRQPNLIRNGDFHRGSTGWRLPKDSAEIVTSDAQQEKNYCLKLSSSRAGVDPSVVQEEISLSSGQRYRLSYRVCAGVGSSETTGYQFFRVFTKYLPPLKDGKFYGGVHQQDGKEWQDAFQQWQTRRLEFCTPIKPFSAMVLTCQLRGPGSLYIDDIRLERLSDETPPPRVRIMLSSPWYRDMIFASTPVEKIQGQIGIDQPQTRRVTLQMIDAAGKVLHNQEFESNPSVAFTISAHELPVGDYHLRAVLFDAKGEVLEKADQLLRKLPPQPNEVTIHSDRVLRMDGKSWFPIGVWGWNTDKAYVYRLCRAGVNTFIAPGEKEYLDLAGRYGAKVMAYALKKLPHRNDPEKRREWTNLFHKQYEANFHHPALLGYFLADEPLWCGVPLEELVDSYEFYRKVNPYRPVFINEAPRNTIGELRTYAAACDITGVDMYPVPDGAHSELPDKTVSCVGKYTEKMLAVGEGRKPVWMTLQGFAWLHLKHPEQRDAIYPTRRELRFMAYDAILHGATGIFFWGTDRIARPNYWDDLLAVTSELRDMSAVLVSPTVSPAGIRIPHPDVVVLHKRCEGQEYVFVENTCNNSIRPEITTGLSAEQLRVLFEDRNVPVNKGVLTDEFKPYDIHIYTTAAAVPSPLVPSPSFDECLEKKILWNQRTETADFPPYKGDARWIWVKPTADWTPREAIFTKEIVIPQPVRSVTLLITADDRYRFTVNGVPVGDARKSAYPQWTVMKRYDLTAQLKAGRNDIRIQAEDLGNQFCAGLLCDLQIETVDGMIVHVVSDETWTAEPVNVVDSAKTTSNETPSVANMIGPYGCEPWDNKVRVEPIGGGE